MTEKLRYRRAKCSVCGEYKILRDDICLECDGGDEFVNQVYKFLKSSRIKTLYNKSLDKLCHVVAEFEKHGWIQSQGLMFGEFEECGWGYKVVLAKERI